MGGWMSRWLDGELQLLNKKIKSMPSLSSNFPKLQLFVWHFPDFLRVHIPKIT